MKKYELITESIKEEVMVEYNKLKGLFDLAHYYAKLFERDCSPDPDLVRFKIQTDVFNQKISLLGFGSKDGSELVHPNLRTFQRGQQYQPLRKNKFNKETTQDFSLCSVDISKLYKLLKGDSDHIDVDSNIFEVRYRTYSPIVDDEGKIFVNIDDRDVTDYVLTNYVEV